MQNISLLWNNKKVLLQIIILTMHGKYYSVIDNFLNVYYLINFLVSKFAFYKQLRKDMANFYY